MSSEVKDTLDKIISLLVDRLIALEPDVSEGWVRTPGPPPYRRLDCRKRALLYARSRPRKRLVRVDVTGLWLTPPRCRLSVASAGGAAIALRSELDVDEAIRFIRQAIGRTQLSLPNARPRRSSRPSALAARYTGSSDSVIG